MSGLSGSEPQAIRILKLGGRSAVPDAPTESQDELLEQARARLEKTLRAMGKLHDDEARLRAGWSYDEEYEQMVPPGWVRRDLDEQSKHPAQADDGAGRAD